MSVIKESSDELNPAVVARKAEVGLAPVRRGPADVLALVIATCGVGYLPLAPGTWGSLLAVGIYFGLRALSLRASAGFQDAPQREALYTASLLVLIMFVALAGVWAATRAEKLSGRKDPRKVVVDEVAGQLIAFLFIPLTTPLNWWIILAGFLLFRFFDILKPYPAGRLEALESGLGIMADDVVAGAYAALVTALLVAASQLI